jgi:hypothetical protein
MCALDVDIDVERTVRRKSNNKGQTVKINNDPVEFSN